MKKCNFRRWRIIFFWASVLIAVLSTIACVVPTMEHIGIGGDGIVRALWIALAAVMAFAVRLLSLLLGQAFWSLESFSLMAHLNTAAPIAAWVNIVFWAVVLVWVVFAMLYSASESDDGFGGWIFACIAAASVLAVIGGLRCVAVLMEYLEKTGLFGFVIAACLGIAVRFVSLLMGQAFWSYDGVPVLSFLNEVKPVSPFVNCLFYLFMLLFLYFVGKQIIYNAMPRKRTVPIVRSTDERYHTYSGGSTGSGSGSSGDDYLFAGLPREINDELDDVTAAMDAEFGEGWGNDL